MAVIKLTIKNLDKIKKAFKQAPELAKKRYVIATKLAGEAVRFQMKKEVPKRTRNLMRSIQSKPKGFRVSIGPNLTDAPYAIYVNRGVRSHIRKTAFGRKTKPYTHPGFKKNPFVKRTATKVTPQVNKIFRLTTDKLLKDLTK